MVELCSASSDVVAAMEEEDDEKYNGTDKQPLETLSSDHTVATVATTFSSLSSSTTFIPCNSNDGRDHALRNTSQQECDQGGGDDDDDDDDQFVDARAYHEEDGGNASVDEDNVDDSNYDSYQVSDEYPPDKESQWNSSANGNSEFRANSSSTLSSSIHLQCFIEGHNALLNEIKILREAIETVQIRVQTVPSSTACERCSELATTSVAGDESSSSSENSNNGEDDGGVVEDSVEETSRKLEQHATLLKLVENVWSIHESHVSDYLFNEESILIPTLATRFTWPTKLHYQRIEIEYMLDAIGRLINGSQYQPHDGMQHLQLVENSTSIFDTILAKIIKYESAINSYLFKHHEIVVPLIYKYFIPNEFKIIMKLIAVRCQKTMFGCILHNLGGNSTKCCEEFMKHYLVSNMPYYVSIIDPTYYHHHISNTIWYLFLEPIYNKYQIVFLDKIREIHHHDHSYYTHPTTTDSGNSIGSCTDENKTTTVDLFQSSSLYILENYVLPLLM